MLQVVASVPRLAPVLCGRFDALRLLLAGNKEEVRHLAAQMVAVVACHGLERPQLDALVHDLRRQTAKDRPLEQRHGSALALGRESQSRKKMRSSFPISVFNWRFQATRWVGWCASG